MPQTARTWMLAGLAMVLPAAGVEAGVVLTQDISRAAPIMHLTDTTLSPLAQANAYVHSIHEVRTALSFTTANLADVDIVYISPSRYPSDGLDFSRAELDALEGFVNQGGRLVISADIGDVWTRSVQELAQRFDAYYRTNQSFDLKITVENFGNPISNGLGGEVIEFQVEDSNGGIISTDDDFIAVARAPTGDPLLGYLAPDASEGRLGEVVFLTDFNTFDSRWYETCDSEVLWHNIFLIPEPASGVLMLGGVLAAVRRRRA